LIRDIQPPDAGRKNSLTGKSESEYGGIELNTSTLTAGSPAGGLQNDRRANVGFFVPGI
jgi:hypothetical protein